METRRDGIRDADGAGEGVGGTRGYFLVVDEVSHADDGPRGRYRDDSFEVAVLNYGTGAG